ncbi:hypothetical protein V6Z11_A02G187700 [Gossypium hirsutum]
MESKPMHTFAVFLLITCHLVLSVEGRLLKSLSRNDSNQVLPPPTPTKTSDFGDSIEGYKEDFRPTTPGSSPGVGHSFAEDVEDMLKENHQALACREMAIVQLQGTALELVMLIQMEAKILNQMHKYALVTASVNNINLNLHSLVNLTTAL